MTTSKSTITIRKLHDSSSGAVDEPRERVPPERRERAPLDRRPCACGQVEYEPEIMQAQEPKPQDLVLRHEMPDVGAREPDACRAAAFLVERPGIVDVTGRSAC